MSEIVTGEAVALELRLAKLPSRLLAAFIDLALQLAVLWLLQILGVVILASADVGLAVALIIVMIVAVFVGYPVTMETLSRGRTLGKMAMGIRVVREDGGPIGFRQALVRGLFAGLLEKPGLLFGGLTAVVGILTMLISTKGKRVGDLAAGTVVLQERVPATKLAYYAQMPPQLAGWAATLDVTGVDDTLALSVRQFLSRLGQLDDSAKAELGRQLSEAVAAVTTPPAPPGTPGWAYLTAVLAERRRREQVRLAARAPQSQRQPYGPPLEPYRPPAPAYPGQPFPSQPFPSQPFPGQHFAGQPFPGQHFPGPAHLVQGYQATAPSMPLQMPGQMPGQIPGQMPGQIPGQMPVPMPVPAPPAGPFAPPG